jgi:hypothetical protein
MGGYRVCATPPAMATSCPSANDQCCPSANQNCPNDEPCYAAPLVPACGGVVMAPHNVCGVNQCAVDADCATGQVCAPAGALGLKVNACIPAHCKHDTDCTAFPGGICAPAEDPCCAATDGLFCVYKNDGGCRTSSDCEQGFYCRPDTTGGISSCVMGGPICPG